MNEFRTIGILGRVGNALVLETVRSLMALLASRKIAMILEDDIAALLPGHGVDVCARKDIGRQCDLVIVVGGDGSMLGAARNIVRHHVPVLGINRGGLGFLTDISPAELESRLVPVLEGHYKVEERFLLDARLLRNGEVVGKGTAFNDVVINSGGAARMISFETWIDDQFVQSERADGLIIATPTGSTAYSLSGGGPIMHPKLDALVLVPMFPHSLSSRPVVIDGNSQIRLIIGEDNPRNTLVVCDGHLRIKAAAGDTILIYKKPQQLKMIHPLDHNFYAVCRDKLGWGQKLVN